MAVSFPEAGSSTAVAAPHRVGGAVANRLARRDVRAHKGRSALIVLMVAIPLILLTAIGSILVGSYHQTPQLVTEMNQATFKVVPLAGANGKCHQIDATQAMCPGVDNSDSTKPLGTVPDLASDQAPISYATQPASLRWKDADFEVTTVATDFTSPHLSDLFAAEGASLPGKDEVAVNARLAQRFGFVVGDRIELSGHPYAIARVVRMEGWTDAVLVGPGHPLAGKPQTVYGYGAVPGLSQIASMNEQGMAVITRDAIAGMYGGGASGAALEQVIIVIGGMFAAILTITVTSAAFAIGVRQQRRTLALLGATGASSATLKQVVVRNGLLLGLVGATSGVLIGLAVAFWWYVRGEQASVAMPVPFDVPWFAVIALWCLGLAAATIAAWIPARQVARQDVLTAVRSSDQAAPPAHFSRIGAVAVVLAVVVAVFGALFGGPKAGERLAVEDVVIPASVCCLLLFAGTLLNIGWLLDRLGQQVRGPLAVRLALRDGSRNRGRAAASVAASLAATALACAALVANASVGLSSIAQYQPTMREGTAILETQDFNAHRYSQATMDKQVAAVKSVMGRADAVALQAPQQCLGGTCSPVLLDFSCVDPAGCTISSSPTLTVASPQVARVLMGEVPEQVNGALAQGKVVVTDPDLVRDGVVTYTPMCAEADCSTVKPIRIPAVVVAGSPAQPMISAETSAKYRLGELKPAGWAVDMGRVPAQAEADRITAALQRDAGVTNSFSYERGPVDGYASATTWFGRIALALLLAIAAVTTMLTLRDASGSQATLAAVGARARTLRGMASTQTFITVALGGLLGLVVGAVPMIAVVGAVPDMRLGVPWAWIAACVVGVPVVAAAATWVLVRPPAPRAARID